LVFPLLFLSCFQMCLWMFDFLLFLFVFFFSVGPTSPYFPFSLRFLGGRPPFALRLSLGLYRTLRLRVTFSPPPFFLNLKKLGFPLSLVFPLHFAHGVLCLREHGCTRVGFLGFFSLQSRVFDPPPRVTSPKLLAPVFPNITPLFSILKRASGVLALAFGVAILRQHAFFPPSPLAFFSRFQMRTTVTPPRRSPLPGTKPTPTFPLVRRGFICPPLRVPWSLFFPQTPLGASRAFLSPWFVFRRRAACFGLKYGPAFPPPNLFPVVLISVGKPPLSRVLVRPTASPGRVCTPHVFLPSPLFSFFFFHARYFASENKTGLASDVL